jgi:hypothetical protein
MPRKPLIMPALPAHEPNAISRFPLRLPSCVMWSDVCHVAWCECDAVVWLRRPSAFEGLAPKKVTVSA